MARIEEIDPVVAADAVTVCRCGATLLFRPVLLEQGPASACMACGMARLLRSEWAYPDNPHLPPVLVATRSLTLDAEAEAWLCGLPRVARSEPHDASGPHFLPAALRVVDEASLLAAERDVARAPLASVAERLRRAGFPGPPPRSELRSELSAYVAVHDALATSADAPLSLALALASSQVELAARVANEQLAGRPALFESLALALAAGDPARPTVLAAIARFLPRATAVEAEALGVALGRRLAELGSAPFEHEPEIDGIARVLVALGPRAAGARAAVVSLEQSELARCRSLLRGQIERILSSVAP